MKNVDVNHLHCKTKSHKLKTDAKVYIYHNIAKY